MQCDVKKETVNRKGEEGNVKSVRMFLVKRFSERQLRVARRTEGT